MQGSVLDWSNSGSDISTGGVGTATVASQSQARLAFCGLDQYRYTDTTETYVSTQGMSSSSTSDDEHAGAWYLIADLAGTPTLFLEATDGRTFRWSVEEAEGGFLFDGYLYRPAGGCQ